jgi:predicted RNase H-like HicB family nuclease
MIRASEKPARNDAQDIARPFDPAILQKARRIAEKYRIVLEAHPDCGYIGTSLEMPGAMGDGRTPDACVKHVREALVVGVAYLIETGQTPPVPADEQIRNKQINIRVTEAEQRRLKEAAAAKGFTDVSDFMRTTLLGA